MTESLLLRLHSLSTDAPVEVCLWSGRRRSGDADAAQSLGRMTLAEAARHASGRRVVGVLPAADVLALAVALPDAAPARLRAGLPFALEEQVAGDIESQHCAMGARGADGRWAVRVIARARLEAWLAVLRDAGLEPQALVSAADGLRDKPGDLMLWLDGDDAHWRSPEGASITLPVEGAWDAGLAAMLGDRTGGAHGLVAHVSAEDRARHGSAIAALGDRLAQLRWIMLTDGALAAFAGTYDDAVNLLQGPYAPRRPDAGMTTAGWRWPLRLAAVAVALQSIGYGIEAWRLHRLGAATDAALLEVAQPLQPGISDPVQAADLLRSRLDLWSRGSVDPEGAAFLKPLTQLAEAKRDAPSLQVLTVSTAEDGRLTAELSAADDAALAAATRRLAAAGWSPVDAPSADATRAAVVPGTSATAVVARWGAPVAAQASR